MLRLLQITTLILLSLNSMTKARFFASSADMGLLIKTEDQVIKALKNYVDAERKRLDFLEKYLNRSKTEYEIAIKDVPYYFGNPINAFTIIKRLGPDLEFVENVLKNKTVLKTPDAVFPTDEDMSNAALGLVSLQSVYNITVNELANGILNTNASRNQEVFTEVVTPMTASDCYSVGLSLFLKERYDYTVSWLEEAYKKLENMKSDVYPVSIINVIDIMCQAYHKLGETENFIKWTEKRIQLEPNDQESIDQRRFIDVLRQKQRLKQPTLKIPEKLQETEDRGFELPALKKFTSLCSGTSGKVTKNLSCYYAHGPHPFLTLAPMKAEPLFRDPDVLLFHGILNDEDIKALQGLATPKLWNTMLSEREDYRNAEYVNLEEESEVVTRVSLRAYQLSGLSHKYSEPLKVINYGIGGNYWHHYDSMSRNSSRTHFRAGTILFYLSDIDHGGATIFPILNLAVFPKKGCALFWMNQFPSGLIHPLMLHAGCPVLRGAKWIATKWSGQFTEKDWCPLWRTEKGIVTEEIHKEIVTEKNTIFMNFIRAH